MDTSTLCPSIVYVVLDFNLILKDSEDVSKTQKVVAFSENLSVYIKDFQSLIETRPLRIEVEVFWVMTPCSAVVAYQCFRGPCCLHLQGKEDGSSMGLSIFVSLPQNYTAS
jgi:hypothetical protein